MVEYGLGGSPGRREFPLDGLGANAKFLQVCGVNLGLLMRHLTGVGTPRSLQGRASALVEPLIGLLSGYWGRVRRFWAPERHDRPDSSWDGPATRQYGHAILD